MLLTQLDARLTARSFQRGVYPAEDFTAVKKYGLNMLVSSDDQVRAYIKKIMLQLDKWMLAGKVQKLVIVITDKDTGEHVERWQFDVRSASHLPRHERMLTASINDLGSNLAKDLQEIQTLIQIQRYPFCRRKRSRQLFHRRCVLPPRENRSRDPSRDRSAVSADHRVCNIPSSAAGRLHLQRAGVRRRVERGARRVGRQRPQGDRKWRARAASQLQHLKPSRRYLS